jgi:Flp pilus assembly protein TadD
MRILFLFIMLVSLNGFAKDPEAAGRTSMAEGDFSLASKNFAEAVSTNPFDAVALNNFAVASAAQGNLQKAMGLLERATRLAPTRADIAANLTQLRAVVARSGTMLLVQNRSPIVNVYPNKGDVPPEPPPLWK